MRSSRLLPDPLDPGPGGFAHRGLHYGSAFPENSLIAFAAALEVGAGIECDLRLTADGRILVFHDADAMRMCGRAARIGQSRHADLVRLRVGDGPIPTLESLFALVDGRVPLLLEAKVEEDLWRWVPAFRPLLADYRGPVGVMSFDPRLVRLLKTNLPAVRRGLVIGSRSSPIRRWLAIRLAAPHFLAVDRACLHQSWVREARRRWPIYSWTIRTAEQRAQAAVQADALIWEDDGRP